MEPKLKAFLSSAQFQDEFVTERDVFPVLFSKEPLRSSFMLWKIENYSSPEKIANHCLTHVNDSDLLLLLLGKTLRVPVKDEFEAAIAANIPVFAFIKEVHNRDAQLEDFIKEKIYSNATATTYSSIKELTVKIEESLLNYYFRTHHQIFKEKSNLASAIVEAHDLNEEERALRLLVGILDTAEAKITKEKTIESLILQAMFSRDKAISIQDISDYLNSVVLSKDQNLKIDVINVLSELMKRGVINETTKGYYQLTDREKKKIEKKQANSNILLENILQPFFIAHKDILSISDLSTYTKIIGQAVGQVVYHAALSNAAAEFSGQDSAIPYDAEEINRMATLAVSSLAEIQGALAQWQQAVVDVLKSDNVEVVRWINKLRKAYWLLAAMGCDPSGVKFKNRHISNYIVYLDSHIVLRAMVSAGGDAELCKGIIEHGINLKSKMRLSESIFREVESSIEAANKSYLASGRNALRAVSFYKSLGRRSDILDGFISAISTKPSLTWEAFLNKFYSPFQPQKLKSYIENELGVTVDEESEFSIDQLHRIEQLCSVLLEKRRIKSQDTNFDEWSRQYTLRTNEAKQMAIVYELRKTPQTQHTQYWFVTFDTFVYRVSVELVSSGESFYSFPCYMKPARWLEILVDASPKPLNINVFRNILISPEISRAADYVESQVIAQMLQARVDESIRDINTLRYMFSDIVNRPTVQDAYAEVMKSKGVDAIGASEKVKDRVIEALGEKMLRLEGELKEKQSALEKVTKDSEKAKGKTKYLKSQLAKLNKIRTTSKKKSKKRYTK